jgi:hypothetical protein
MDERQRVIDDLIADELDLLAAQRRRSDEEEAENQRRYDLLLRARDAGMTNREIAEVLNRVAAGEFEHVPGALPPSPRYSTRSVGKDVELAEAIARHAVRRLIEGDRPEDDGDDDPDRAEPE